ncbi:EF-hand calcium-binding domain-containing protein 11 isoform X2 [Equus asinus]|uniref:EF-hand calcium-binding domain-containing protein 11 isoform X2 n=1 Tax=Equus asinus TaxID=9793 RepID=UPI001D039F4D|nr:EF-hand calcium-binding domain-containing protein 11 isoform X3 [Equus asinus]
MGEDVGGVRPNTASGAAVSVAAVRRERDSGRWACGFRCLGSVVVFKACDEDNKGYLSREDFKVAVVTLFGYKPSKIEANSVMSSINPNTSGILLGEFLNIVRKKKEAQLYRNEIRHIFTAFDRHYRGYLTLEDFQKAFKQVAPKLPERIILEVFREVDQDSDDLVSYKDFEYAMNYGQNEA